jgi:Ca-activated chloride channel family protein
MKPFALARLAVAAATLLAACAPPNPSIAAPAPGPGPAAPSPAAAPVAPAPAPSAPLAAPSGTEALSLKVLPRFDSLVPGTPTLDVLVRLEGAARPGARRPPLDLAVVIDRSGSMQGDKILSAKAAALDLLRTLGPDDRLTLVSYSDAVQTHFAHRAMDATGVSEARDHILAIHADGSTALGPAMASAFASLRARGEGRADRLAHVILTSDGIANVGESRPEILGALAAEAFRAGISLSTLGVGLDYAEDLMTTVADQGGGRYHFIKDAEAVSAVLADELKGLTATVAAQTTVALALPAGVSVARVYGYPTSVEGGRTVIRVGGLGAGVTREIVVKLALTGALGKAPGAVRLGGFSAAFRDVARDGAEGRVEADLGVSLTSDARAAAASERSEVAVRVSEVEAADKLTVVARSVEAGNFEEADEALSQGIGELRRQQASMAAPSPKIEAQIMELEAARGGLGAARASGEARKDYVKSRKADSYQMQKR